MANILAVDDNLELCKLIRTTLERDGHRVETRQAGRDLTEVLCRWADCILLDVMMPGEDGFAVCRRIRSLTEVPILFLSARTDEAAVLEGLGIGADDFLSKPFRVAELRARVAAHLRRQSRTPAHRMVYPAAGRDAPKGGRCCQTRPAPARCSCPGHTPWHGGGPAPAAPQQPTGNPPATPPKPACCGARWWLRVRLRCSPLLRGRCLDLEFRAAGRCAGRPVGR